MRVLQQNMPLVDTWIEVQRYCCNRVPEKQLSESCVLMPVPVCPAHKVVNLAHIMWIHANDLVLHRRDTPGLPGNFLQIGYLRLSAGRARQGDLARMD